MQRPSSALLESAYDALFLSPFNKLVDAALYGRLFNDRQVEDGVVGRSMAWKLFLLPQAPLTASLTPHASPPMDSLRSTRERYVSLLKEKMRAPDGSYEEGLRIPGGFSPPASAPKKPEDWNLNNPLSLDSSNPWHAYFSAIEARNVIRQDVERTFPEMPYFRSTAVQDEMTSILYLYCSEREDVGYRQGMHELLACVYRAVDYDSIQPGDCPDRPELETLCDRNYVAADAFTLFSLIMHRMELWYEWRAPTKILNQPGIPHFSADGELVPTPNGQIKSYVTPIIPLSASIRDEKLRLVDPHLFEKLREANVEPQMFGMRWLRLLFTREFSLSEAMVLWDGLFASVATEVPSPSSSSPSTGFELAYWICVTMLMRIRNALIPGDYTDQLTNLLRYPPLSTLGSSSSWNSPELLLSQAQHLVLSPSPGTGVSIMMQNRNELGIPVEIPDAPVKRPNRRRASGSGGQASTSAPSTLKSGQSHERPRIQDVIASRLMDANETYGIQRGLLSTISEIRKNLPELPQTLIRSSSWNSSAISLAEERGEGPSSRRVSSTSDEVVERPPWEPRTRIEMETEVAELRSLLKTLGDAVSWAVDVLLQDEETAKDTGKSLAERKREAIECMAYVRDVMAQGGKGEIDEERLVGEEEYQRRKHQNTIANLPTPQPPKPAAQLPPVTIPRTESHARQKSSLGTKEGFTPTSGLPRTPPVSSNIPSEPLTRLSSGPITQLPKTKASKPPPLNMNPPPKKVIPPWEHTPSNFSADSPYTASLPRLPPPLSTTSRTFSPQPSIMSPSEPEAPKSDPLGVQIL